MDDRFSYILNTLWSRHYDLGRVIRFREVVRGRQAPAYEILTAEGQEYVVYLFPPAFDAAVINEASRALAALDAERFSVVPAVKANTRHYTVGGPQGATMLVTLQTAGQVVLPDQWTPHDISQLGLRLAWLHRLAMEQLDNPEPVAPVLALDAALSTPDTHRSRRMPALPQSHLDALLDSLDSLPGPTGYVHGDISPSSVLMDDDHQIRTLVDWALFHPGEPLEDLIDAFTHWCLASDGIANPETGRVLLESYRSLRTIDPHPWPAAVRLWLARRIIDATHDRRPLPRGFANYLANPDSLAQTLDLCETK